MGRQASEGLQATLWPGHPAPGTCWLLLVRNKAETETNRNRVALGETLGGQVAKGTSCSTGVFHIQRVTCLALPILHLTRVQEGDVSLYTLEARRTLPQCDPLSGP